MLTTKLDHNKIGQGAISADALMAVLPGERPYPTAWAYLQAGVQGPCVWAQDGTPTVTAFLPASIGGGRFWASLIFISSPQVPHLAYPSFTFGGVVQGEADMTEGAKPSITGIHHFSPTVTDVEASVAWYQRLFGMDRVPVPFPHYEREDTGYAVVLIEPRSGVLIGLHKNEGNRGESFDECHTGLDHCSFGVASRDELVAWVARLDELGIQHTGIRDEKEPFPYSTVVFRDPDNIQLELIALG